MTSIFGESGLLAGLETALASAGHLGPDDAPSVTVAQCLARRIDRLIEADEPVSASLFTVYERALGRLGLASPKGRRQASSGKLEASRANLRAVRSGMPS